MVAKAKCRVDLMLSAKSDLSNFSSNPGLASAMGCGAVQHARVRDGGLSVAERAEISQGRAK